GVQTCALPIFYFIDDVCVATDSNQCDVKNLTPDLSEIEFEIYPSLTSNEFYLKGPQLDVANLLIYNALGQRESLIIEISSRNIIKVNCAALPDGIYFIEMSVEGKQYFQKMMIEH